jgi:hypothetical protein
MALSFEALLTDTITAEATIVQSLLLTMPRAPGRFRNLRNIPIKEHITTYLAKPKILTLWCKTTEAHAKRPHL